MRRIVCIIALWLTAFLSPVLAAEAYVLKDHFD